MKTRSRIAGTARQRGAATLIVVMVLFFIMLMITAYANRSLVFEQKTSANQYRSTQAFEAAEAGLEWSLAMLNQGLVDDACVPDPAAASSFRDRYLDQVAGPGTFGPRANPSPAGSTPTVRPGCVRSGDDWLCSCPAGGNTGLAAPDADQQSPSFTVEFGEVLLLGTPDRYPGLVRIVARGCSGIDPRCVQGAGALSDAYVPVEMKAALVRALATPPAAALTVRGQVSFDGGFRIVNTDTSSQAITVHSGDAVDTANAVIQSVPGAREGSTTLPDDGGLAALGTNDEYFRRFFGIDFGTYRDLPTVSIVPCPATDEGDCSGALAAAVADGKRMLWINGPLVITEEITIGTPERPVVIVATGRVRFVGPVRINGLLYGSRLRWENTGVDDAWVRGAVVMREACCTGSGTPSIVYDNDVLNRLHRITGAFVRVNGSWKESFN